MITRIEIDGFKSFLDFKLDVPPFLALVGPNSSGKSNLFDAIEFDRLSRAGSSPMFEVRRGRPAELFHRAADGVGVESFSISISRLISTDRGLAAFVTHSGAQYGDGYLHDEVGGMSLPSAEDLARLPGEVQERMWHGVVGAAVVHDRKAMLNAVADLIGRATAAGAEQDYVPDPQAMRRTASAGDRRPLLPDGANLAVVLGRMRDSEAFGDLMVDLAALIPDVKRVVTYLDERRQEWSFDLIIDGQGAVSSSLLSDGTLGILGLLAALHDPDHAGVLLIEEIENGLHPSRLAELLRRIQDRVTDLRDPKSLDRPLRQVILTSHSPVVVSELNRLRPDSLIFLDSAVRVDPEHGRTSRVTVAKPVRADGEPGTFVSPRQVRRFLGAVRQDAP